MWDNTESIEAGTTPEPRHGRTLGISLALILFILGAYGLADAIDRHTDDRIAYRQWVAETCIPAAGQTAIATHDGKRLRCTLYSQIGYGLAPIIISAAVMEPPQ